MLVSHSIELGASESLRYANSLQLWCQITSTICRKNPKKLAVLSNISVITSCLYGTDEFQKWPQASGCTKFHTRLIVFFFWFFRQTLAYLTQCQKILDGWRNMQIPIYISKQKCLRTSAWPLSDIATEKKSPSGTWVRSKQFTKFELRLVQLLVLWPSIFSTRIHCAKMNYILAKNFWVCLYRNPFRKM